jgi:hypothetical protein
MPQTLGELADRRANCVTESRSSSLRSATLTRRRWRLGARPFAEAVSRSLPLGIALAVALISGSAVARGHGGSDDDGGRPRFSSGYHPTLRQNLRGIFRGIYGGHLYLGDRPAWDGSAHWDSGFWVYCTTVDPARRGEPRQRAVEALPAQPEPHRIDIKARPVRPASSADIYEYADDQDVLHFTDYRPANGQGRIFLHGEPPASAEPP